jgi:endonuclease G
MPPRRTTTRSRTRPLKLVFGLNLVLLLALGGWFLVQPTSRQEEVRTLVENYLARNKRIELLDVVRDIWTLYYSDQFVAVPQRKAEGNAALYAGGARQTSAATPVRVLVNSGYVVGYSDILRDPLWAAYRVWDLPNIPEPPPRPDKFAVDLRTVARVEPSAYSGSGYDRGHMAPNFAIATRFGAGGQEETFLMSNIVPQKHALNAGVWKELELRAATSYAARFREVWVMAGPIFGKHPARLRGGVTVPEACWMVMLDEHEGRVRTQAFVIPQDAPVDAPPDRYLTSIDHIEELTGLDLFPDLPDAVEAVIESKTADRVW